MSKHKIVDWELTKKKSSVLLIVIVVIYSTYIFLTNYSNVKNENLTNYINNQYSAELSFFKNNEIVEISLDATNISEVMYSERYAYKIEYEDNSDNNPLIKTRNISNHIKSRSYLESTRIEFKDNQWIVITNKDYQFLNLSVYKFMVDAMINELFTKISKELKTRSTWLITEPQKATNNKTK